VREMLRRLSTAQHEAFWRDGVVFPVRACSAAEAARLAARFAELEHHDGGRIHKRHNEKPHLLLRWASDLIRDAGILDAVEDLIGPDLMAWQSGFFAKHPRDGGYVSWHQDATYWGLSSADVVNVWLALTPSTLANGCMQVIPGSHLDALPHRDTFAARNMLSRGQEVSVAVDESKAVAVELQPGEMSLHHVRIVHGSADNAGEVPRIGYAIRYIAAHVRQTSGTRDSATLVRGADRYGNFELEPAPASDFHPDAVAYHAQMLAYQADLRYRGAARGPSYEPVADGGP
jgi:phytanoyl-CoA dioxygenase PhyH